MQIPFFEEVAKSERILIAGAGGGFDIVSGLPLYFYLSNLGKNVVLANLSFTALSFTESEEVCYGAFLITSNSLDVPYFPEKFIVDWLQERGETPYMYGFSNALGVANLRQAYEYVLNKHNIDTLILVDGGTDSLMFGDEDGVATIVEDACSTLAARGLRKQSYLVATGFGVEQFHHLDHYACLENIATLIKAEAYKGAISLMPEMMEGQAYIEFVEYANKRFSHHKSIVANSIMSAIKGEYGDFHSIARTNGSEQFISPLMGFFWFFDLEGVASRIAFANEVDQSMTMTQVANGFTKYRLINQRREKKKIPL